MTTFFLIRHAERTGDPERLIGRLPGWPLTPAGRRQADRLAQALADEPIQRIISSPLERAHETAAPLARTRHLAVELCPAIGEIDFGEWTGRTFSELAADPAWVRFNQDRPSAVAPGGEALGAVQARFVSALQRWRNDYPDTAVALVSHADPIKLALAYFLGAPLALFDRIEIRLGSVSVLELDPRHARVVSVNDVPSARAA